MSPNQDDFPPPPHIQDALDRLNTKKQAHTAENRRMTKKTQKTRNPQDTTLRNARAAKKRAVAIVVLLTEHEVRITALEDMSRYARRPVTAK